MITEPVSGRTQLRYRGEPVTHDVTFTPATPPVPYYRGGGTRVRCTCGWHTTIDSGHSDEEKARLARQHATGDP